MSLLPIVKHHCCELTTADVEFAEKTAARVIALHPEIRIEPLFEPLVSESIVDAPSLHADDLTGIQKAVNFDAFYQERARLRAMDGDLLATALPPIRGYEAYCRETLGLGDVEWLTPECGEKPLNVVEACYTDRAVRGKIVRNVRQHGLRYIHPHLGSTAPWELALLIHQASHLPIHVIAPPPGLTRFVNDKGSFTKLVHTMFGDQATPPTEVVWNMANAASRLQALQPTTRHAAIKLPSASGGGGNLLIDITEIHGRSLTEIDDLLHERLPTLMYESGDELLVTLWEENLVASPSAQFWIPPRAQGNPILEGLFLQLTEEHHGRFSGFVPANLPSPLEEKITRQCLLLANVFQFLGYVGRCSVDMLLVGATIENSKMQFIECNGRWGGTSLPMTVMNRMFSDWRSQPFSSRTLKIEGVDRLDFSVLLTVFEDRLYRQSTNAGEFILFNPQRTRTCGEVSLIALRNNWSSFDDPFQSIAAHFDAELPKYDSSNE